MEVDITNILIEGLLPKLDLYYPEPCKKLLEDILDETQVPVSGDFAPVKQSGSVLVQYSGKYPRDSVRITTVIKNYDVSYRMPSERQEVFDMILMYLGRNSQMWLRRLMSDREMIRIMHSSNCPYSLLAELTSYDEARQPVAQKPLIVIPGVSSPAIEAWETQNIVYRRKGRFGIPLMSTNGQYFGAQQPNTPSETSQAHLPHQNP